MQSSNHGRHMRYDRILAVLLVLILLIVLLVKCCSGCSSSKKKKTTTVETTATEATETPTQAQDYSNVVYLSPSSQADNAFDVGDTDEATECRKIAEKTAAILEQSGLTVMIADESASIQEKTAIGDNNLAAYVAIHTNQGTGVGTDCYYNSASEESKALAQAVYDPVATLTPTTDRGLLDGSQSGSDAYQYEIGENNSPCCLIEVEFHDGPNVAQWILDNEDDIAAAIATGICNYLGVTPAASATATDTETGSGTDSAEATTSETNAIENQLSAGN